jgi:TolA-binding protein
MCRKPFVAFTALSVFLFLLSSQVFVYSTESVPDLASAKDNVCNLMDSGRFSEAAALVNGLITGNSGDPNLPDMLFYSIAENCRWSDKYEEEKNLYQQIMQDYPNSSYAGKARLGFSRSQIQCLILTKDYSQAKEAFSKLVTDFSGHPDLPDALYWIAERYRWAHRWEDATGLYRQIIQNYPDSLYAARASLGLARMEVVSLIAAKDYKAAGQAFDKLVTTFSGHPDLPETLYWIAEGYRWAKEYEKAKSIYQQIMQNYPNSSYASKAQLGFSKVNDLSLIVSQNYDGAKKALDKLVADFPEHPDLTETLYGIGREYEWQDRYEEEKAAYQQIIQNYPNSPYASKAQLGFSRAGVRSLIVLGQYDKAKAALDKLVTDFSGHPDLPEALYWIARRYGWSDRFEEEKSVYQRILQNYPDSSYAGKARLGFSRANVLSLIVSQNYDGAKEAFDKLVADFSGHPDLPETFSWIAQRYEFFNRYEDAKNVYQQMSQQCSKSAQVKQAQLDVARTNICSLIVSGQADAAGAAIDKMKVDFSGYAGLPDALCKIANSFERSGNQPAAEKIYRQIIQDYPSGGDSAVLAKAQLAKYELFSAIESGDKTEIEAVVWQTGSQSDTADVLDKYLSKLARESYSQGRRIQLVGDANHAVNYFAAAVALWERVFTECPNSPMAPVACFSAAAQSAQELGDYSKAVKYFQKVVDKWPNYINASWAQSKVADYLQEMVKAGLISSEQAQPMIIKAYQAVIDKYPYSDWAELAKQRLK